MKDELIFYIVIVVMLLTGEALRYIYEGNKEVRLPSPFAFPLWKVRHSADITWITIREHIETEKRKALAKIKGH